MRAILANRLRQRPSTSSAGRHWANFHRDYIYRHTTDKPNEFLCEVQTTLGSAPRHVDTMMIVTAKLTLSADGSV